MGVGEMAERRYVVPTWRYHPVSLHDEVRRLRAEGMTCQGIADAVGMSRIHVWRVLAGKASTRQTHHQRMSQIRTYEQTYPGDERCATRETTQANLYRHPRSVFGGFPEVVFDAWRDMPDSDAVAAAD